MGLMGNLLKKFNTPSMRKKTSFFRRGGINKLLYIALFFKEAGDADKMTEGTTSPSIDEGNSPTKSSLNMSFSDSEDEIPDSVIKVAFILYQKLSSSNEVTGLHSYK